MKAFLESRFSPAHLVEFRCIRADWVQRIWSRLSQVRAIEGKLRRLDQEGWDVYCGVNPRSTARSDERAVTELVAFHVDFDGLAGDVEELRRFASKSDTEKDGNQAGAFFSSLCALRAKRDVSLPEPSQIVSSGSGGVHLYFILEAPVAVSEANRENLRAINRGLALAFGGDTACCDLSRVLRIPSFRNHKHQPREVTLVSDIGPHYTVEQLQSFAVTRTPRKAQPVALPEAVLPMSAELYERFVALRRIDKQVSKGWRGELGDGSSDSRYALVVRLREHGFSPEEIVAIVCSRRWYNRRAKRVPPAGSVLRDVTRLVARRVDAEGLVMLPK